MRSIIKDKNKTLIIVLFALLFLPYILENTSEIDFGTLYYYLIKPIYFCILSAIMMLMPNVLPHGRYKSLSTINLVSLNFALIYILSTIVSGIIDGFGKSPYNHSPVSIIMNLFSMCSSIVAIEMARNLMINTFAKKERFLFFLLISVLITVHKIPFSNLENFVSLKKATEFISGELLPGFSKNLFITYLTFIGGYKPSIIYNSIIETFYWLSPILPNLRWIIKALFFILVPILSLNVLRYLYLNKIEKYSIRAKSKNLFGRIITPLIAITMIWFASGMFPIYPSVIATGSMEPSIKPGDVIMVEKKYRKLKVGDIIQYRLGKLLISHRIVEINIDNGRTSYTTKGDNNPVVDSKMVQEFQIKGRIIQVIPKIGWPTLILKSRSFGATEKVVP